MEPPVWKDKAPPICILCELGKHDDCPGVTHVVNDWKVIREECKCPCRLDTKPVPE